MTATSQAPVPPPWSQTPVVALAIFINVAVYILFDQQRFDSIVMNRLAFEGQWWRIFGSGVLHAGTLQNLDPGPGIAHLGMNLFAFTSLARLSEVAYRGHWMLVLIVGSIALGNLSEYAFTGPCVGFSSAVAGLYAFAAVAPRLKKIDQQPLLHKQQIHWLLTFMVFSFILSAADSYSIANVAHLGGAIFGALLAVIWGGGSLQKSIAALGLVGLFAATFALASTYPPIANFTQRAGLDLIELGIEADAAGDTELARERFEMATRVHRPQVIAWRNLLACCLRQEDLACVESTCSRAAPWMTESKVLRDVCRELAQRPTATSASPSGRSQLTATTE